MKLTVNLKIGEKITIDVRESSIPDFNKKLCQSFDQGFLSLLGPAHNIVVPRDNIASIILTMETSP